METPGTTFAPEISLPLFNPDGTLIGMVVRPRSRDAVGPGREKVYLAREQQGAERALNGRHGTVAA